MEFTGSIQFADESSWLTLTTESDDTVTITVKFGSRIISSKEVLSFDVTPNSGIVRLPAGEILRALMGNGIGMVTGSFSATQGSSSCSYSFSVLPCRKFDYKSLSTTIFTTRPTKSPAYEGAKDRLYFYRTSGDVSTYVRFKYRAGGMSSSYTLTPTYYVSPQYYDLDISVGTMLSTAASKGLDTSKITGFEIWIEYSGSKSETYSFDIRKTLLPLKTYKFLGRRGTYEYIHATGKFSRSIDSETQVFVNSGIEQELENDYSMTFEQNSGHIDSIGMNGYWLEFLASKERYIIEKDGSERAIVVDEFKTSLTDRAVSSLTFTWHYANPSNTTIDMTDIPLTGLTVSGASTVNNDSNTAQFSVGYTPSNTTQRGVTWSITSGSAYASIDQNGLLTVKNGANANNVTIKVTSTVNSSISATKSVSVTHKAAIVAVTGVTLNKTALSLSIGDSETLVATVAPERATDKSVVWSSSAPSIASVDQNGKVTAKAAGTAVITVKTNDGSFTARCNMSVAAVLKYYTLTVNCTTSGATVKVLEYVAGQTSIKDAVDYTGPMTFKENTTVKVWCHKNGMIDSGIQTIQMTSDKTVTVACKSYPSWDLPATYAYDKDGTNYPNALITDEDNVGWKLEIPDWIQTEGGMTSGTVTISLMIVAEANTGASRSGVIRLKSADGSETLATCSVTQEAGDAFKLPDSYTELNYIASKGTVGSMLGDLPYIDTGISDYSDLTYHVEYTVYPNSESGLSLTTYPFIMGSLSARSTGSTATQIFTGNFPGGNSAYGTSGMTGDQSGSWSGARNLTNNITLFGVIPPGVRHTLEWNFDQGYVVVDGDASIGKIVGAETSVSTTGNSCFLFAINAAGSPVYGNGNDTRRGWQKLHRFWMKDSLGNVQCDLIPARDASGTVGMYDTIGKRFLTSANSVPFTGPEDDSSVETAAVNASIKD